jgi:hypothetical protein
MGAAPAHVSVQVGAASRRFGVASTSNATLLAIYQQLEKKEQTRFVAARINDTLDVRHSISPTLTLPDQMFQLSG